MSYIALHQTNPATFLLNVLLFYHMFFLVPMLTN